MRFKASIQNIHTFNKFVASLASLGHIAWVKLNSKAVHFTVIPEQGTQVWSVLSIDSIFETYTIQSASEDNTINLEVPLAPLQRALKSAQNAIAANIRLTKKDGIPLLSLTITTLAMNTSSAPPPTSSGFHNRRENGFGDTEDHTGDGFDDHFREETADFFSSRPDRETTVTQDIPVRVLAPASVEGLHEPRSREPEVHIVLPNLMQLKSISDRFTRLALSTKAGTRPGGNSGPKLELSGNMHGCLRLSLNTDSLHVSSLWTNLENPELDPGQMAGGEEGLANHPSTRMKMLGDATGQSEEGWSTVRVDGKDWGRVLSVGRLGGRVIACFSHDHAIVLYVYTGGDEDGVGETVLTYYISSYSA
ncbi:Checkpoint protein hus1 [Saxophila tyrrhenica]|uniref:Checkpoint protein n=1 Tax=Saxophila tyrrhenica TaxID=1690608 RepID=A0AAV9PIR4_9PEZI|nr:Checkpoint protein hus1 [Saxophila tyrrhenica]